jgi:hypothetical protein
MRTPLPWIMAHALGCSYSRNIQFAQELQAGVNDVEGSWAITQLQSLDDVFMESGSKMRYLVDCILMYTTLVKRMIVPNDTGLNSFNAWAHKLSKLCFDVEAAVGLEFLCVGDKWDPQCGATTCMCC